MLETLVRPSINVVEEGGAPMKPKIGVVYPENAPSVEAYQTALGIKSPLEKIPVLELKDGEPIWELLAETIDSEDLEEIKRRNIYRDGNFTVYLSPDGYSTLIDYWTHPRFGDLLDAYRSKTPPTKDVIKRRIKEIVSPSKSNANY